MKKSELKEVIKGILKEEQVNEVKAMDLTEFCDYVNKTSWENGDSAGSILSNVINIWEVEDKNQTLVEWIDALLANIKKNLLP